MKSSFCKLYFGWFIDVECFFGCIPYINRISNPAAMSDTVYIVKGDFFDPLFHDPLILYQSDISFLL